MSQDDNKKKNIGGIWEKVSQNGTEFLSISIEINGEKMNFSAFKNSYHVEGDNKPTWNVAPPRDNAAAPAPAKPVAPQRAQAPAQRANGVSPQQRQQPLPGRNQPAPQRKPAPQRNDFAEEGEGDIPF